MCWLKHFLLFPLKSIESVLNLAIYKSFFGIGLLWIQVMTLGFI